MAAEFIGYTVLVTLAAPLNAQVQGVVANVIGQTLILQDANLLWNGQNVPTYHIDSTDIADLEISPRQRNASTSSQGYATTASENVHPAHQQNNGFSKPPIPEELPAPERQTSFIDPAILSYTKPTIATQTLSRDSQTKAKSQVVSPVMIADSDKPFTASPAHTIKRERKDSTATATLTEPFNHMAIEDKALSEAHSKTTILAEPGPNGAEGISPTQQKKSKRGRKGKDSGSQTAPGIIDIKDLHSSPMVAKNAQVRGKGWRQTPLTRDTTPRKKNRHQNGKGTTEDANGWATEDATDIQDLGEFDFQTNLSKFDKRRVFDDIRKDDVTAVAERLVSFNRKFRPGTNNGKNLHYTENVLDPPKNNNLWKSEAGETEEEEESAHQSRYSSSRASRRDRSHSRKTTSRKGSAVLAASVTSASKLARGATGSSLTNSPLTSQTHLAAAQGPANTATHPSLRILSTNKPCPTISTFQMLELESLCTTEVGLSEDILTENAGRGIAETVLKASPFSTSSSILSVLMLVGNHKSGARTVAAARHLRNHGVRVTVCVLGGERETDLLESLRRQLDVYRKSGGWVMRWDEYRAKHNAERGRAQQPNPPPDVIVDALLGMHVTFDILRLDDQAVAWEMVGWVNWLVGDSAGSASAETKVKDNPKARGKTTRWPPTIFSIDIPFGLDPTSGIPTLVDSSNPPLVLRTSHIIVLGAPKIGLVEALFRIVAKEEDGGNSQAGWEIWAVDLGIGVAAWKKGSAGSRRRIGVEFGREWSVKVGLGVSAPVTAAAATGRERGRASAPSVVARE